MKFYIFLISILFSYFSFANYCHQPFYTGDYFKEEIGLHLKNLTNDVGGDVEQWKYLLDQDLDGVVQFWKSEGALLSSEQSITRSQILLSKLDPNYLKESLKRYRERGFTKSENTWSFPSKSILKNLSAKEKRYYFLFKDINEMLLNKDLVFKYMQRLEDEVILYSKLFRKDFDSLEGVEQVAIKQNMLKKILAKKEKQHGFLSDSSSGYAPRELPDGFLSGKEWNEMLSSKIIFNDTTFFKADEISLLKGINAEAHGYLTHRIQFYLVAQHIDHNLHLYKGVFASDIYGMMGNTTFNRRMGLGGEFNTLWAKMMDVIEEKSFKCPEYLRRSFYLWPDLGLWY